MPSRPKAKDKPLSLVVNGTPRQVAPADADMPLVHLLRNDLNLTGTKLGCGKGECGACAVLMDGQPIRSCVTPVSEAAGKSVTTIEGLGSPAQPHPVQAAFVAEQAAQCGYCTAGMVVETTALLAATPQPSRDEAKAALDGHLCRCGSHHRILRAIMRASGRVQP